MKRRANLSHMKRRGRERVDAEFSKADVREISKIIVSSNKANKSFVQVQIGNIEEWLIKYKGELLRVIYDPIEKTPVTLLPVTGYHNQLWHEAHPEEMRASQWRIKR